MPARRPFSEKVMRTVIRKDDASTIWVVANDDGATHYEVECGVHRVVTFDTENEAHAHFDRWAPEARHQRLTFDEPPHRRR
jgi:hypothetical protein